MGFFSWWAKNISIPSRELPEHPEPPTPPAVPPHFLEIAPRTLGTAQLLSGSVRPVMRVHALDTAGVEDERTPLAVAAIFGGETWTNVILVDRDGALLPVDGAVVRVCDGANCSVLGCTVKWKIDSDRKLTEEMFQQERSRL